MRVFKAVFPVFLALSASSAYAGWSDPFDMAATRTDTRVQSSKDASTDARPARFHAPSDLEPAPTANFTAAHLGHNGTVGHTHKGRGF